MNSASVCRSYDVVVSQGPISCLENRPFYDFYSMHVIISKIEYDSVIFFDFIVVLCQAHAGNSTPEVVYGESAQANLYFKIFGLATSLSTTFHNAYHRLYNALKVVDRWERYPAYDLSCQII